MPWDIKKGDSRCPSSRPFAVVKRGDGSLEGCHASRAKANAQVAALYANEGAMPKKDFDLLTDDEKIALYYEHLGRDTNEATWSRAFINNLPDASFAVIEKGGTKDSEGKTTPRSYRHLPHHGKIASHSKTNTDESHLKNAAARANQLKASSSKDSTERIRRVGKSHLRSHYRAHGMDIPDNLKEHAQELIETTSTDILILEADKGERPDHVAARARFEISRIDKRNRNGRVYPRSVWETQVSRFVRGSVTGQDGHPGFFSGTPKVTDAFLVFDKLEIEGDKVFAEADVLNTTRGRDFVTVAKAGAKIADSTRGFGKVKHVDEWDDGKPAGVVQDDFKLVGVDVMFDFYQSTPTAKLRKLSESISFIHEDYEETVMDEMTVEWLTENAPEVVEEIETAATHELEHEIEELNDQVVEATARRDEILADLAETEDEAQALTERVEGLEADLTEAQGQVETLTDEVADLTAQVAEATARAEVGAYAYEKCVGEPAAMLMLKELTQLASTAEVDESFRSIKKAAERILSSLPAGTPRSHYLGRETDDDTPPQAPEKDYADERIAKEAGLAW